MPMRKPRGLILWPMGVLDLGDGDGDVAAALVAAGGAALGGGAEALDGEAGIDARVDDGQIHRIDAADVRGVRDRALERLLDHDAAAPGLEREHVQRVLDALAADQADAQPGLAGADARVARDGLETVRVGGAHGAGAGPSLTFFSPPWPRKVRVTANSPSLCPTMLSVMNTWLNDLPLCTAKVWPMKSGTTVHAR